jgi:hypothetical protein
MLRRVMPKLQSNVLSVEINGKHVAALGFRRSGNGSVIVNMFSKGQKPGRKPLQGVSVGGLEVDSQNTHYFFHYLKERALKIGDVVTITVCETGKVPRIKPTYTEKRNNLAKAVISKGRKKRS